VELLNHFEVFFKTFIKPSKDLLLEGNFMERDDPFPKEAFLQILKVTQIILENCANKYLYNFNEVVFHPIPHFSTFFFLLLEHLVKGLLVLFFQGFVKSFNLLLL
jgi:hypothetical protein